MSSTANKTIVRRFVEEVLNAQELGRLEEFLAPDYVDHSARLAGRAAIDELRRGFESWYRSFPDHRIEIRHLVAESEFVASTSICTVTHRGEYLGVAPTNRRISFAAHELFLIRRGQIAEHWEVWDEAAVMRQISAPAELGDLG